MYRLEVIVIFFKHLGMNDFKKKPHHDFQFLKRGFQPKLRFIPWHTSAAGSIVLYRFISYKALNPRYRVDIFCEIPRSRLIQL